MGATRSAAQLRAVLLWFLHHVVSMKRLRQRLPRGRRPRAQSRVALPPAPTPAAPAPAAAQPVGKPAAEAPAGGAALPPASHAAAGAALFGGLLFVAGAFPGWLPAVFLAFAATALPWRVHHYTRAQPRNQMYLLDFCYAVAAAVAAFLLAPAGWRRSPGVEAAVYALADGPVAGALVAWQCAWVFHSADHTVSVLLHLLPGLAMAAHHHLPRHAPTPTSLPSRAAADAATVTGVAGAALWLLAAPLAYYLAWQALYFLAVQVLGERYVRSNQLDTSYRCLTRRARRAGNIWARLVLRGGTPRRLVAYGLLQLAFTVTALLLFIPTYHSAALACAWQAVKFLVPVIYGCKYQRDRVYKAAMAEGVRRHLLQLEAIAGAPPAHK